MRFKSLLVMAVAFAGGPAPAAPRAPAAGFPQAPRGDLSRVAPSASAAEIPALAKLLEQTGWTPTPELSGIFRAGAIFSVAGGTHALLAADCIGSSPEQNAYTAAEVETALQAGVSVRAGLARVATVGEITKKVKFSSPEHWSIPIIDFRLTPECHKRLNEIPADKRAGAYAVREVLRAEIAEQTCGRINAEGRFVVFGAGDTELALACAQESAGPVGVGFRIVPLDELMRQGPPAVLAPAESAISSTVTLDKVEPRVNGPFALVLEKGRNNCSWHVEDLPTGRTTNVYASATCPTEIMWNGGEDLYYKDGEAVFQLTTGELRAIEVPRPADPECGGEQHHWLPPRLDRKTGRLHWACWVHPAETALCRPLRPGERLSSELEAHRYRAAEVCDHDEQLAAIGTPIVMKDHQYARDLGWTLSNVYRDCQETEGCGWTLGADGELAPPTQPVNGMVSRSMVEAQHHQVAVDGCANLPADLANDPSLAVLLGVQPQPDSASESLEYRGCPIDGAGFLFWAVYSPIMDIPFEPSDPVVMCDATCRRRTVINLSNTQSLTIQMAGRLSVVGPGSDGETILVDVSTQSKVRSWGSHQTVLVLPVGTPTPLGIRP
jgi:hypothetical protein